jgi:M-phase inducer tyrosine phosphatase
MDVDSPYRQQSATGSSGVTHSLSFDSPASSRRATEGSQPSASPDFGSFFCDSPSAPQLRGTVGALGRMNGTLSRRTSSPASPLESPSTSRPPSVASRMFEKTASTNVGGIFGGNGLSGRSMVSRRTQPYKRPILPPLVSNSTSDVPRVMSTASALPVLENGGQTCGSDLVAPGGPIMLGRRGAASMRRAYSVCDQGAQAVNHGSDPSDRESVDDSPCAGSRVVSHFEPGHPPALQSNGSGFRTVGHSSSFNGGCVPSGVAGSPFGQGMLGFGENEKDGKLLPCHRVKEDGLVRITPETVSRTSHRSTLLPKSFLQFSPTAPERDQWRL